MTDVRICEAVLITVPLDVFKQIGDETAPAVGSRTKLRFDAGFDVSVVHAFKECFVRHSGTPVFWSGAIIYGI